MSDYYRVFHIESIETIRSIFEEPVDFSLNWLFLSTSGVHGSYQVLDDLKWEKDGLESDDQYITVLVLKPRVVQVGYGSIEITESDVPFLRGLVSKTLLGIISSQRNNIA